MAFLEQLEVSDMVTGQVTLFVIALSLLFVVIIVILIMFLLHWVIMKHKMYLGQVNCLKYR